MSPLSNVWKFFGKLRKKHRTVQKQTFRQVSKIFENLLKSSEVFGHLRKKIGNVAKCSRQPSSMFYIFYEIFGNHRRSSEVFGCLRKSSEIFGKSSNVMGSLREFFITFQFDTCGLKIGFTNFDL